MRFAALLGLAILASPAVAFAQGASGSASFVIMNPAVVLAAGSKTTQNVSWTPINVAAGTADTYVTLGGSNNPVASNENPSGTVGSQPLLNVTDNAGGNTLAVAPDFITLANPDVVVGSSEIWQLETYDLRAPLTAAGCLKAQGCNPTTVLQVASEHLRVLIGGTWTAIMAFNGGSDVTLAGILAAGNGAILP